MSCCELVSKKAEDAFAENPVALSHALKVMVAYDIKPATPTCTILRCQTLVCSVSGNMRAALKVVNGRW